MRYLIQLALVILFFALPVYMDFLQLNMFLYLYLGMSSPFPAPVITMLASIAALLLFVTAFIKKINRPLIIGSVLMLLVPVIFAMKSQWQFNSLWATIAYISFFVLAIVCTVLVIIEFKK